MKVLPIHEGERGPKPFRWEHRHPELKTDVVSVTHTGGGLEVVVYEGQLFLRTDGDVVSMGVCPREGGTAMLRRTARAAAAAIAAGGAVAAFAGALPLAAWLGTAACLCALVAGRGDPDVREKLVDIPVDRRTTTEREPTEKP